MDIKLLMGALLLSASSVLSQSGLAATQLGSSDITFGAHGSPGSMAGTWSAPALDIEVGDTVQYFSLEIIDVQSPFGSPISLSFVSYFPEDSRALEFGVPCPIGISCVGQPSVGSVSIVNVDTSAQSFAIDFLFRLDPDASRYTSSGPMIVGFSGGGSNEIVATGSVRVTAFGIAQAIPEPDTYAMLLAGLGLVSFISNRKHRRLGEHTR